MLKDLDGNTIEITGNYDENGDEQRDLGFVKECKAGNRNPLDSRYSFMKKLCTS